MQITPRIGLISEASRTSTCEQTQTAEARGILVTVFRGVQRSLHSCQVVAGWANSITDLVSYVTLNTAFAKSTIHSIHDHYKKSLHSRKRNAYYESLTESIQNQK